MSFRHIQVTDALVDYIRSVSAPEPDVLLRLREETARDPLARMQITVEQGILMGMLARLVHAKKALEIGVFTDYSSISVARALPDDGRLIACDVDEHWTSIARRYWMEAGVAGKIELRLQPAVQSLQELHSEGHSGSFDFAFIDADKANYDVYYEHCITLVRPGGLIAVDNVLWHGQVMDAAVNDEDTVAMRAFNLKRRTDDRVHLCMLPMADGITLALKK